MGGDSIQTGSDIQVSKYGNAIPVGECTATDAGTLPFKKIVHAIGPKWTSEADE